jgi:diguanylate cyclase (GGDEF)-like protein/PAS domain S-box-containing protein
MLTINSQLFADSMTLRVSDVLLFATDSLQTHREKLARIVLDEMFQFVGLLDANGMIVEINRAALAGAGIRLDDIQGKPFWEARWWTVSKATQDCARDAVRRASQGEFVRCDVENYGQGAGEETITVDFSLLPIRDQDGRIVLLLAEGRNISAKKRAEAEVARKNEELQQLLKRVRQLDQLKSDLFANVSHELRTPLALILGPAESILATGRNLTELQQRDLRVIHRNAATLLKHVNDLLDLAKLDAGKMTVNYARVDLARAVRTVAAHFDALAPQRSLSYVIAAPDSLEAEVDPEKFDRILLNLLSNAFKFTPAGGRIQCALGLCADDLFLLSVQDSGPGVRAEMRTAIFERFRQAQEGTAREFGGTGLGLAIVKDFVDLHGGTISVSEATGGGALFQVAMPLRAPEGTYVRCGTSPPREEDSVASSVAVEELQQVESHARPETQTPDGPLVLVAEDNAEMRRFITEVLGSDYRVVTAADGGEALTKAIAEPPDLVVTDLMMPKMGGDRLVDELRARSPLAHVPVMVMSAKADEALRIKLLTESVQDYLTKPFSAHELRARVRNLVTMKRARDVLQKELATQNEDLSQLTGQLVANRQALRHLAYFDPLTDLPNRVQLQDRLTERITSGQRNSRPLALLILALERFKEINFTLGQANGDLLLQQVGPRLRLLLHEHDVLAYLGGRRFAVLLHGRGAQAASELAARILKSFEQPFAVAGFMLEVGAEAGIAVFPGHGEDAETLMRCAEVALYRAQQSGSGHALYAAEHDPYNARRLQLMGELRSAIDENQLVLYCQPKLDLRTREIVAMETLVRWQHPSYGLICPDQFVPFVESTGLIGPLTRWILDAAIMQCHAWQQCGMRVPVAVNLSTRNLGDAKLIEYIHDTLVTWGAEASWLELEITESAIMADPRVGLETLARLSSMGLRLFIDDFGTGYSSLAYLQKLPVNAIKIDKSFVLPMLEDPAAAQIVRSTLELGHNLGLKVIAEGVENESICERLVALGCDEAQGYYLSRPMPASEFIPWAKTAPWPLRAADLRR